MVADIRVDMVDMELDMVADIDINMEIQFGERWKKRQTLQTRLCYFVLKSTPLPVLAVLMLFDMSYD